MKKVLVALGIMGALGVFGVGLWFITTGKDAKIDENRPTAVWVPLPDDDTTQTTSEEGVVVVGFNNDKPTQETVVPNGGDSGNPGGYNPGVSQTTREQVLTTKPDIIETITQPTTRQSGGGGGFAQDTTWEPMSGSNGGGSTNETIAAQYNLRSGDYIYDLSVDGNVTITGYTGGSQVVIPVRINGYTVTGIGMQAFYSKGIKSITFENGSRVKRISNRAFAGNCHDGSLSVALPDTVTVIGDGAFAGISVTKANSTYFTLDYGCVYNGTTLVSASGKPTGFNEYYKMLEGTEKILGYAFEGCSELKDVKISSTLKNLNAYAFSGCTKLGTGSSSATYMLVLPAGVEFIWGGTFEGCYNLRSVKMMCIVNPASHEQFYSGNAFANPNTEVYDANGKLYLP